jgi:hypothetical protein
VNKKNPCPFFLIPHGYRFFALRWEREEEKAEGIEDSFIFLTRRMVGPTCISRNPHSHLYKATPPIDGQQHIFYRSYIG